jgi:hypothetical protein
LRLRRAQIVILAAGCRTLYGRMDAVDYSLKEFA